MAGRFGLQIRRAVSADAPGLADLFSACGHPVSANALAARLDRLDHSASAVLLALEWGPPSGVIALQWRRGLLRDDPVGLIDLLLVRPEDRRRGLGRLLLKAGAQSARAAGCADIDLAATSGETTLIAFGAAAGFHASGQTLRRSLRKRGSAMLA